MGERPYFFHHACKNRPGGRLWVVDSSNNRVVWFNNAHSIKLNQPDADGVLGQPGFTTDTSENPPTKSSLKYPFGATLDSNGNLYVADSSNNRVLRFNNAAALANGANADVVFGQPDFTSSTANNGGISAARMNYPLKTGLGSTPAAEAWP